MGLVPASLPHALGYACTLYAPTSPPPKGWGLEGWCLGLAEPLCEVSLVSSQTMEYVAARTQHREMISTMRRFLHTSTQRTLPYTKNTIVIRRKPKGDGGKGTGKKMSRQFATNVTTIYDSHDNLRHFMTISVSLFH